MQQLSVTLSQIVDLLGMERARLRNQIAKISAAVAAAVYGPLELILPFFLDEDLYQTARIYLWLVSFPLLNLIYTISVIYLESKMRQLNNFQREIRSVRLQFLLLLIAFWTDMVYELAILLGILNEKTASQAIIDTYLNFPCEIVPILYFLHSHHVVFKEVVKLRASAGTENS